MTGACWSTAICTESERRALGLASDGEWLLTCRLSDGHEGEHATDASMRPRSDRRVWLTWNDRAAHRLVDREPCPMHSRAGTPCLLFAGHGGMHYYGAPGGPAQPTRSIDAPDVRMPSGGLETDRRPGDPTVAPSRTAARDDEPLDVDVSTGPSRTLDTHERVTQSAAAPQVAQQPVAQQPAAPQAAQAAPQPPVAPQPPAPSRAAHAAAPAAGIDTDDAVATALQELAAAIENLAQAVRRRSS